MVRNILSNCLVLTGLCSLVCVFLGVAYSVSGRPFVQLDDSIGLSKHLVSSGGDSNWFLSLALYFYLFPLFAMLLYRLGKIGVFSTLLVYGIVFILSALFMFLVNLDTSVVESVMLGDLMLLLAIISSVVGMASSIVGLRVLRK